MFHVAAILKRNKSTFVGTNVKKTHPMCRHYKAGTDSYCRSLHAEQNVCRRAQPGDELFVMRFTKDGRPAMAKPCKECQKTIREAGIKKVWYTNRKGRWSKLKL